MILDKTAIWGSWVQLWNGDLAIADTLISPQFSTHFAPMFANQAAITGPDGIKQMIQMTAAFKDHEFITEVGPIADGDMITGRWTFKGVYMGGIPGASAGAVGKQIHYNGIDILRVVDEQIVEYWLCSDTLSMLQQIGVIPS